jgi:hypothetical protein
VTEARLEHPDDLSDAIGRAAKAANRAGVLPRWWVALAVEALGRWYVVVLGHAPGYPVVAVYRIRPDLRLRRIVRWPWPLANLARARLTSAPLQEMERPGLAEGWVMTSARLRRGLHNGHAAEVRSSVLSAIPGATSDPGGRRGRRRQVTPC